MSSFVINKQEYISLSQYLPHPKTKQYIKHLRKQIKQQRAV